MKRDGNGACEVCTHLCTSVTQRANAPRRSGLHAAPRCKYLHAQSEGQQGEPPPSHPPPCVHSGVQWEKQHTRVPAVPRASARTPSRCAGLKGPFLLSSSPSHPINASPCSPKTRPCVFLTPLPPRCTERGPFFGWGWGLWCPRGGAERDAQERAEQQRAEGAPGWCPHPAGLQVRAGGVGVHPHMGTPPHPQICLPGAPFKSPSQQKGERMGVKEWGGG